jgi:tRNA-dihydrouridine synthase A
MEHVEGVMLGRAAYHNPMLLSKVDEHVFGAKTLAPTLPEIAQIMMTYTEQQIAMGVRLNHITRHMIGLAHTRPGARRFRQILTMDVLKEGAGVETIERAFEALEGPASSQDT